MTKDLANQSIAVIGYGITGQACVRFLLSQQANVCVIDSDPEIVSKVNTEQHINTLVFYPNMPLSDFAIVVVSPGVDPHQTCFRRYTEKGGQLIGDIELFAWFNHVPIIGITGSNGKTTVTDMLGKVLNQAGLKLELAGNYGKCAVELLSHTPMLTNNVDSVDSHALDLIVLELSSYQLEITTSLQIEIATVLNITEDHLDRHGSFAQYKKAKHRIFNMAKNIIVCRDEPESYPPHQKFSAICAEVGSDNCARGYSVQTDNNNSDLSEACIQFNGEALIRLSDLALKGIHNHLNVMTVLAICDQLKLDRKLTVPAICAYTGMPHRFEIIKKSQANAHEEGAGSKQITWINDSKATNIGACKAALACFSNKRDYLILIAGGDAKGVNLLPLFEPITEAVNQLIVLGKDASKFIELFPDAHRVSSLQEAVSLAIELLESASFSDASVLLSPACASIDMFKNYQQRGDIFSRAVNEQVA